MPVASINKMNISLTILSELFDKQIKANCLDMENIFVKNNEMVKGYFDIIVFNNHQYRKNTRVKSWAPSVKLHDALAIEMNKIIEERTALCEEKRLLEAWFRELCAACSYADGVLKCLPEALLELLPEKYTIYNEELANIVNKVAIRRVLANDDILNMVAQRKLTNILLG
jgi:hypothetical protein